MICTLGNFATKLLSGSPQGITRVRGVPQAHELGGRPVFLYPIFHPAAALRTPAMLDQLRADFQALPRLLAEALPSFGRPRRRPEPEARSRSWSAPRRAEPDQLGPRSARPPRKRLGSAP